MSVFRRLFLTTAAFAVAGCGDSLRPIIAPPSDRLAMFVVLDPDQNQQLVVVQLPPENALAGMTSTIAENGSNVATGSAPSISTDAQADSQLTPCINRYGGGGFFWTMRCVGIPFAPVTGSTYDVSTAYPGRPVAHGTTTVPGAFTIASASATATPPGASNRPPTQVHLKATWTRSAGAYRYAVGLDGADVNGYCFGCPDGLWAITDTTVDADVPYGARRGQSPPFTLRVFALSKELYDYLVSGNSSRVYPVPPIQNVENGYGGVGAWVQRSRAIP